MSFQRAKNLIIFRLNSSDSCDRFRVWRGFASLFVCKDIQDNNAKKRGWVTENEGKRGSDQTSFLIVCYAAAAQQQLFSLTH